MMLFHVQVQPLQIKDSQAKKVMGALSVFYRNGREDKLDAISNVLVYGQLPLRESGRPDMQHSTYTAALTNVRTELKPLAKEAHRVQRKFWSISA